MFIVVNAHGPRLFCCVQRGQPTVMIWMTTACRGKQNTYQVLNTWSPWFQTKLLLSQQIRLQIRAVTQAEIPLPHWKQVLSWPSKKSGETGDGPISKLASFNKHDNKEPQCSVIFFLSKLLFRATSALLFPSLHSIRKVALKWWTNFCYSGIEIFKSLFSVYKNQPLLSSLEHSFCFVERSVNQF